MMVIISYKSAGMQGPISPTGELEMRAGFSITLLASAALTACSVGPEYRRPGMALTDSYTNGGVIVGASTITDTWWREFDDPLLDRIVERALSGNLDIARIRARLDQARAAARHAGAALAPSVGLNASASTVHQSTESPIGKVGTALGAPRDYHDYSIGTQASWELDLFGGLRRSRQAADAEAQAAEIDAGATRLAIAAETADAYFALRGLQARLAVARRQEETQAKLVALIRQRADEGIASDRDLQRATGDLEGVRASIPPLRTSIDAQLNRLDILMGAPAGTYGAELTSAAILLTVPSPSGNLTPADLLRHRPDVVAAERRLAASNARIGAAIAEYYPHVSIGALLGTASVGVSPLFTGGAAQAAGIAGLRWRLFDFGRVDAEVAMARGREAEALAAYRAAALRATEDVENALSFLAEAGTETAALERQITALDSARDQTRTAYREGLLSLIEVLDVDRQWLAASDRLETAKSNRARASVASFRALGGGWREPLTQAAVRQ
jgi:NodT family efflux transporter outer membrane factor (OMF) lipoprotein